ncbi:MAG: HEPN domain-containing protein [Spirochaetaceae bacterium]|nr:HEPN domain-containing protein [Spirochaetaceae bacterium]
MSNHERGRKLMAAALEYLGEMDAAIARGSWNIAVRHAQEVVELVMKAVLGYLCIDYPKVHDTADVFIAALGRRQMGLSDDEAADVRAVSSRLAEKRAPAFYFEYDEDAKVARAAAEDARRIHRLCTRLVNTIAERERQDESHTSDAE